MLTNLVRNDISNIVKFANEFEGKFVKIVVDEEYKSDLPPKEETKRSETIGQYK